MSDLIRKMMGQNRGPIGLGNNPSPFQIPYPSDVPQEPAMPDADAMRKEIQSIIMDRGNQDFGNQMEQLRSYYETPRKRQQEAAPQMPIIGGPRMGM